MPPPASGVISFVVLRNREMHEHQRAVLRLVHLPQSLENPRRDLPGDTITYRTRSAFGGRHLAPNPSEQLGRPQLADRWHCPADIPDRKSTRLNSSHLVISYAVFCLKKKKTNHSHTYSR